MYMKLPSLSAKLVLAFAIVILNLPTPAIAQSIASLQTNLTKKSSALSTLENRIISYGQRQLDAEEKLQEALQDLSDATSELETARQNTGPEAANQQTWPVKKSTWQEMPLRAAKVD
jgi:chromosome segregation ATPase